MKVLIVIFLSLSSHYTFACDCIVNSDPKTYLSKVDLVFIGKVVELIKMEAEEIPLFFDTIPNCREKWKTLNPDKFYARVLMIDNIKGDTISTDTLFFSSNFSNCDPIYELNQTYLFFADHTQNSSLIMAHCTPWGILENSKQTIEQLKK